MPRLRTEKKYQSLFFLLIPELGREWKLVTENETFLMLSLAMKNHGSDYAEVCFIAWEWDVVRRPNCKPHLKLH